MGINQYESSPTRTAHPLVPSDAVAALLTLDDGRYIMQLRDDIPGIFFPAHWGCFGGAIEQGETPEQALQRELLEELELDACVPHPFTRFSFDFAPLGHPLVTRIYFEVQVPRADFDKIVLHEGADFQAIAGKELLSVRKVTPYDAFAIWMHMNRQPGVAGWPN
jgi:8-oxo-dGTP pyrophosphatase MutT (NUDIX family)